MLSVEELGPDLTYLFRDAIGKWSAHGEAIGKPLTLKFVRGGAAQEVNIVVSERPRGGQ